MWKIEARSWKMETRSWKMEIGIWKMEMGIGKTDIRSQKKETRSQKMVARSRGPGMEEPRPGRKPGNFQSHVTEDREALGPNISAPGPVGARGVLGVRVCLSALSFSELLSLNLSLNSSECHLFLKFHSWR